MLACCALFMLGGYFLKAQCVGNFNERSYRDLCYNDIQPLFGLRMFGEVDGVQQKVFPYIDGELTADQTLLDGAIEYPVLTGVFMWATAAPSGTGDDYLRVSALALTPFGLLVAYLLARMAGNRGLLWAAAPALVLYSFHNWDLLVVAASVSGLWMWWKGKRGWAAVFFGVGAALKMYPILFLGPLFFESLYRRDFRAAFRNAALGLGTIVLINLPFALANPDGWAATYLFHKRRGPNIDSIWWLGWPEWGPDRLNLMTGGLTLLFVVGCLVTGWLVARRRGLYPFLQVCAALLVTFLLWNKVHSPQYTLWLLPFFVLVRVSILWWVAYAVADLAVYLGVFRYFYDYGQQAQPSLDFFSQAKGVMTVGVWARAVLLLILAVVFLTARESIEPDDPDGLRAGDRSPVPSHPPASFVSA